MNKNNSKKIKKTKFIKTIVGACSLLGLSIALSSSTTGAASATSSSSDTTNLSSISNVTYQIYPTPHKIEYDSDGSFYSLKKDINVIFEKGIDKATIDRLNKVLALKGVTSYTTNRYVDPTKTNIIIGLTNNSDAFVDTYVKEHNIAHDSELFNKTDSYLLDSHNNVITILGNDFDASFFGVTTLWHIFSQLDGIDLRNFIVEDYADVVTRGAIEGYYGTPWTVQDRINYMKWGSYYKLNAYFYAPKDDNYHAKWWNKLYDEETFNRVIKPVAEAAQETKVQFIFALHPFGVSGGKRFADYENKTGYNKDLSDLKAKFLQVIKAGVRQISILTDDVGRPSINTQIQLLNDMVSWLKSIKNGTLQDPENEGQFIHYPDMKVTLPYVVQEYGGWGENYFKQFPKEVQIVMTGGRVWGEVSPNFVDSFTKKAGRGPLLWINWPCSDNSKSHLIMGGYANFLHPGVNPNNVQGIILNPMQQSEPSKVALFGNADYSWNIWKTADDAKKTWNDSFTYVENNSPLQTLQSEALKELSKHMINQNMDGRVATLQESIELNPKLQTFLDALSSNSLTDDQIADIKNEFKKLEKAARLLIGTGHNRDLIGDANYGIEKVGQMRPFLDAWVDLGTSVQLFLNALIAYRDHNDADFLDLLADAKTLLKNSRNHAFKYINHTEKAEVGVQHIKPFVNKLNNYLEQKAQGIIDPRTNSATYISDVFNNPSEGQLNKIFELDNTQDLIFKNPNQIMQNNYIGVKYDKPITLKNIFIVQGGGKNHFYNSKLQYSTSADGNDWQDITNPDGETHEVLTFERAVNSIVPIKIEKLNILDVRRIRLVALSDDNVDKWLSISKFNVNIPAKKTTGIEMYDYNASFSTNPPMQSRNDNFSISNLKDAKTSTEFWLSHRGQDWIRANDYIIADLGEEKEVFKVLLEQGSSNNGDVLNNDGAKIQYTNDDPNSSDVQWHDFSSKKLGQSLSQEINGYAKARYFRVLILKDKNIWWRLGTLRFFGYSPRNDYSISVTSNDNAELKIDIANHPSVTSNHADNWNNLFDDNKNTFVWLATNSSRQGNILKDSNITINTKTMKYKQIVLDQSASGNDSVKNLKVQIFTEGKWQDLTIDENPVKNVESAYKGKWVINIPFDQSKYASAFRFVSLQNTNAWWKIQNISFQEWKLPSDEYIINGSTIQDKIGTIYDSERTYTLESSQGLINNYQLQPNQYVGIDFKKLKNIESILLNNFSKDSDNIKLQYSSDGQNWINLEITDSNITTPTKAIRYIRIVNTSETETSTFNIAKLIAITLKQPEYGKIVDSNLPNPINGWGDTRDNGAAFDGNMNTQWKIGASLRAEDFITFDIGKEIDLNSIKIYSSDNHKAYLRDATIYASNELNGNWIKLFDSPAGLEDTSETLANVPGWNSDNNYPNVKWIGKDDLELENKVRYIKIVINKNFPNRALILNEIVLNNGKYISVSKNPNFEGTQEKDANSVPNNMIDNDFATKYVPNEANSSITYTLDNPVTNKALKIVSGLNHSTTKVIATLLDDNNNLTTVDLGYLITENTSFTIPENKKVLSVKFEWHNKDNDEKDYIPSINEIIFYDNLQTKNTNFDKLEQIIQSYESQNTSSWLSTDREKANINLRYAKQILMSKNNDENILRYLYSQEMVNTIYNSLNYLLENHHQSPDLTELKNIYNQSVNKELSINEIILNHENWYEPSSITIFKYKLNEVKKVIENNTFTQEEVDNLVNDIQEVKSKIKYLQKTHNIAIQLLNEYKTIDSRYYDNDSFSKLQEAEKELKSYLEKPYSPLNEESITPDILQKSIDKFEMAKKDLKENNLGKEIAKLIEAKNNAIYVLNDFSFLFSSLTSDLQAKLNEANKLINASQDSENLESVEEITTKIKQEIKDINDTIINTQIAKNDLIAKLPNLQSNIIQDLNPYTDESKTAYSKEIERLNEAVNNLSNLNDIQINEIANSYNQALNNLKVKDGNSFDPNPIINKALTDNGFDSNNANDDNVYQGFTNEKENASTPELANKVANKIIDAKVSKDRKKALEKSNTILEERKAEFNSNLPTIDKENSEKYINILNKYKALNDSHKYSYNTISEVNNNNNGYNVYLNSNLENQKQDLTNIIKDSLSKLIDKTNVLLNNNNLENYQKLIELKNTANNLINLSEAEESSTIEPYETAFTNLKFEYEKTIAKLNVNKAITDAKEALKLINDPDANQDLTNAIKTAETINNNSSSTTQQLKDAKNTLDAAVNSANDSETDYDKAKNALIEQINSANEIKLNLDPSVQNDLQTAIDNANSVKNKSNPNATKTELETAKTALETALNNANLKSDLAKGSATYNYQKDINNNKEQNQTLASEYKGKSSRYVANNITPANAVANIINVKANDNDGSLTITYTLSKNGQTSAIKTAIINNFQTSQQRTEVETLVTAKSNINKAIADAKEALNSINDPNANKALSDAIKAAEDVNNNSSSATQELTDAKNTLDAVVSSAKASETDYNNAKTALDNQINTTTTAKSNLDPSVQNDLQTAIDNTNSVKNKSNPNATKTELETAKTDLETALNNAKLKTDLINATANYTYQDAINSNKDQSDTLASEYDDLKEQYSPTISLEGATANIVSVVANDNNGTLTITYKLSKNGQTSANKTAIINNFQTSQQRTKAKDLENQDKNKNKDNSKKDNKKENILNNKNNSTKKSGIIVASVIGGLSLLAALGFALKKIFKK